MRVLGDIFGLRGFFTWHLVMTILMCCVWLILFCLTLWAFAKGKIFMAKPEDVIHDSVDHKLHSPSPSARFSFASPTPILTLTTLTHPEAAYDKEAHGHSHAQV